MIKIILFICFLLITCIKTHNSETSFDDEQRASIFDFKYIFQKYGNNSNLMNLNELNSFLYRFQNLILINTSDQECFKLKFNNLLNQTLSLTNDTIISENKFSKLSFYLISYIDQCSDPKMNLSLFNFNNDQEHEHKQESRWTIMGQNILKISKESKLIHLILCLVSNSSCI